jgi:hypothetical protein
MELFEEFKLYENLWDNIIVEAGNNYTLPNRRYDKTINRPSLDQYFNEITGSREAASAFIKNNMAAYTKERGYTPSTSYYVAMSKSTSLANMNVLKLDTKHNYAAFVVALSNLGITKKDIRYLWCPESRPMPERPTGSDRGGLNAEEVFTEKTSSLEAVKAFMYELGKYPNKPNLSRERQKYEATYSKWFSDNTSAVFVGHSSFNIKPEHICWRNFVQTCGEKFNLTARDLTKMFREAEASIE